MSISIPAYLKEKIADIARAAGVSPSLLVDRAVRMFIRCTDTRDENNECLLDRFWIEHPPVENDRREMKKITPAILKIMRAALDDCSFEIRSRVDENDTFKSRVDAAYVEIATRYGVDPTLLRSEMIARKGS